MGHPQGSVAHETTKEPHRGKHDVVITFREGGRLKVNSGIADEVAVG